MTNKNIEVEFRASLDDKKYNEMTEFFSSNAELVLNGQRVTTKYGPNDIRIREDWNGAILTLKSGDINDLHREEYEVKIDDVPNMKKIIELLGLQYVHSWKTVRKKFRFKGFEVCIDEIPGFMNTLEIEKKCSVDEVDGCKEEIQELFDSLGLRVVDPEWFKSEIEKYNKNFLAGKIKV